MGSLTTRNSYGLKGYLGLSQVSGDEWGLEATASSLPASESLPVRCAQTGRQMV